jgi:hypothetical protein
LLQIQLYRYNEAVTLVTLELLQRLYLVLVNDNQQVDDRRSSARRLHTTALIAALAALRDASPVAVTSKVTEWLLRSDVPMTKRYTKLKRDVIEGFVRRRLVKVDVLDEHLAAVVISEGNLWPAATDCAAHLVHSCVIGEPCVAPAELPATLDALHMVGAVQVECTCPIALESVWFQALIL